MNSIIQHLLFQNQYLLQIISFLFKFICKYIPLRQWVFDDSNSPDYQKFKVDEPPLIKKQKLLPQERWNYKDFMAYIKWKYNVVITPVKRRGDCNIPDDYICPHCSHTLVAKKDRKFFRIHKCVNPKCPYYLNNLKKVDKKHLAEPYGKNYYKLHYIYREFTVDFFDMELSSLPKNSSSLKFSKHNAHIMSLCLTLHVNLGLSLRKTAQAMNDLYGIKISHQMVSNYARTAALVIKPVEDKNLLEGATFSENFEAYDIVFERHKSHYSVHRFNCCTVTSAAFDMAEKEKEVFNNLVYLCRSVRSRSRNKLRNNQI